MVNGIFSHINGPIDAIIKLFSLTLNKSLLLYTYTLFDGLAYNMCGYFASCVVFFRAPQGCGKIRAMSKMSARIIC